MAEGAKQSAVRARENGTGSPTNSLFETDLWLDAVAPGRWRRIEVVRSGELAGSLPIVESRSAGVRVVDMPALTQTLGPWLAPVPTGSSEADRMAHYMSVLGEMADRLPDDVALTRISLHHSCPTALPFLHRNFEARVGYTHVLTDLSDLERMYDSFSKSRRREIRKARSCVEVTSTDDLDLFERLIRMVFDRQGLPSPYDFELIRRLDAQLARAGRRQILIATDDQGRPHAGLYVVHDPNAAYLLMEGSDPQLRGSNANTLLTWEAIRFAATCSSSVDFAGCSLPQLEISARRFGARQVPYVRLTRQSLRYRGALLARDTTRVMARGVVTTARRIASKPTHS